VTLVTQTRVREGMAAEFGQWQRTISAAVAEFPGFITQSVVAAQPAPAVDWVIQQRFANVEAASCLVALRAADATAGRRAADAAGHDDVHLVRDSTTGVRAGAGLRGDLIPRPAGPGSGVRAWEQRIAIAQAKSAGFQGYPFEPPIQGVQDDWLAILRLDTSAICSLARSPERKKLLQEAAPFLEEFHARVVRTGFEQWFPSAADGTWAPAVWKMTHAGPAVALIPSSPCSAHGCRRRS